jgi:hypothetical protein
VQLGRLRLAIATWLSDKRAPEGGELGIVRPNAASVACAARQPEITSVVTTGVVLSQQCLADLPLGWRIQRLVETDLSAGERRDQQAIAV